MVAVATYNIHSCVGLDGRLDPRRIADVIAELDADIIALQEVDAQHRIDGYLDQWAYLARACDRYCTPGISLRTHRRNFGNALLTRQPVATTRLHDLSFETHEPRGAIDVTIAIDGQSLRIIATHFGLRRAERRHQAARLSIILAAKEGAAADGVLLLGDLNEWRPGARSLDRLLGHFHPVPAPRSFPANRPIFALDRIAAAGAVQLTGVAAHRSRRARIASDHLPVRAALSWA